LSPGRSGHQASVVTVNGNLCFLDFHSPSKFILSIEIIY
jgi:hypothetical protein